MGRLPHPNRAKILHALWMGGDPKEVAYDLGVQVGTTYKLLRSMEMIAHFITRQEWEHILNERKTNGITIKA
tara:strand:+ start:558 stop:773 length:216 start_codon:yes stop_codon:yes gene_type:complete